MMMIRNAKWTMSFLYSLILFLLDKTLNRKLLVILRDATNHALRHVCTKKERVEYTCTGDRTVMLALMWSNIDDLTLQRSSREIQLANRLKLDLNLTWLVCYLTTIRNHAGWFSWGVGLISSTDEVITVLAKHAFEDNTPHYIFYPSLILIALRSKWHSEMKNKNESV